MRFVASRPRPMLFITEYTIRRRRRRRRRRRIPSKSGQEIADKCKCTTTAAAAAASCIRFPLMFPTRFLPFVFCFWWHWKWAQEKKTRLLLLLLLLCGFCAILFLLNSEAAAGWRKKKEERIANPWRCVALKRCVAFAGKKEGEEATLLCMMM